MIEKIQKPRAKRKNAASNPNVIYAYQGECRNCHRPLRAPRPLAVPYCARCRAYFKKAYRAGELPTCH